MADQFDVYTESAVDDIMRQLREQPRVSGVTKRRVGKFFVVEFTLHGHRIGWIMQAAESEESQPLHSR